MPELISIVTTDVIWDQYRYIYKSRKSFILAGQLGYMAYIGQKEMTVN